MGRMAKNAEGGDRSDCRTTEQETAHKSGRDADMSFRDAEHWRNKDQEKAE